VKSSTSSRLPSVPCHRFKTYAVRISDEWLKYDTYALEGRKETAIRRMAQILLREIIVVSASCRLQVRGIVGRFPEQVNRDSLPIYRPSTFAALRLEEPYRYCEPLAGGAPRLTTPGARRTQFELRLWL
jgi:hypothetical protein